jgi:hypothetical protein
MSPVPPCRGAYQYNRIGEKPQFFWKDKDKGAHISRQLSAHRNIPCHAPLRFKVPTSLRLAWGFSATPPQKMVIASFLKIDMVY